MIDALLALLALAAILTLWIPHPKGDKPVSTNQPRWSPTWHNLLAVAALVLFILAALASNGTITGINWAVLACCGLACLAAEGIGF